MARAFVTGWPLTSTRSPLIHNTWAKMYGIDATYEAVPVPPEGALDFLHGFAAEGYVGGNVTMPHKSAAFAAASHRGEAALRMAHAEQFSANTVWLERRRAPRRLHRWSRLHRQSRPARPRLGSKRIRIHCACARGGRRCARRARRARRTRLRPCPRRQPDPRTGSVACRPVAEDRRARLGGHARRDPGGQPDRQHHGPRHGRRRARRRLPAGPFGGESIRHRQRSRLRPPANASPERGGASRSRDRRRPRHAPPPSRARLPTLVRRPPRRDRPPAASRRARSRRDRARLSRPHRLHRHGQVDHGRHVPRRSAYPSTTPTPPSTNSTEAPPRPSSKQRFPAPRTATASTATPCATASSATQQR